MNIAIKKKLQSLFKKFFYSVFHLIYGRIDDSIVSDEKNRIKVTNLSMEKNWNYKIYQVKDGRLYTDRVRDLAVILDNNIIEGPSYQLRKKNITFRKKILDYNLPLKKWTIIKMIQETFKENINP